MRVLDVGAAIGGILGGAATTLAAAGTIFDLIQVYEVVVRFWDVVRDFVIVVATSLLSLPELGQIDALFLTMLGFLSLSFISTLRRGRRFRSASSGGFWVLSIVIGFGVIFFLFARTETILYVNSVNAGEDAALAHSADFYRTYYQPLGVSAWLSRQNWAGETFGPTGVYLLNRVIFYGLVGGGVVSGLLIVAFIVGYTPSARGLAIRIWVIIALASTAVIHSGVAFSPSASSSHPETPAQSAPAPAASASPASAPSERSRDPLADDASEHNWTRY